MYKNIIPVTVSIATYNSDKTIEETLLSIFNQTVTPELILISDNNSTDNTINIISNFKRDNLKILINASSLKIDSNIKFSNTIKAISNFNFIINNCKTKYLAIYHSDDVYQNNIVELEYFEHEKYKNLSAVFARNTLYNKKYKLLTFRDIFISFYLFFNPTLNSKKLLQLSAICGNVLEAPTAMLNLDIIKDQKFRIKFNQATDLDFWLMICKYGDIKIINRKLYKRRISNFQDSFLGKKLFKFTHLPFFEVIDHYSEELQITRLPKVYYYTKKIDSMLVEINTYIDNKQFKECYSISFYEFCLSFWFYPKSLIILFTYKISQLLNEDYKLKFLIFMKKNFNTILSR